jgi:ABC-type multidrug transport system fused ATPase/permease subunit
MAGEAVAVAEVEMKEEENQQTISNGKSEINKKSEKKESSSSSIASLRELYMLADKSDLLVMCVGFVAAAMNGLGDPILIVLFSNSLSALSDPNDAIRVMSKIALIFVGVGAALQVAATIQYVCFTRVAKNLTLRMRKKWYAALLRQETCWFDENNPSGLAAKMAATMMTYEQGLGGQLGIGVQFLSGFVGSVIIAFYFNAYVALLTVATMPLCSLAMWYMLKLNDDAAESKERCYSRANSLAYEAFVGLKTVLSLNCSDKIQKKYEEATNEARKAGIVRSIKVGFATGSMLTTMNLMYLAITLFGGWALSVQVRWYTSDQRIIEDSTPPTYTTLSLPVLTLNVCYLDLLFLLLMFCWWVWLDVNTCMA